MCFSGRWELVTRRRRERARTRSAAALSREVSRVNVCVTCFSWRWELVTRRRRERARTRSAAARFARNTSSCTRKWTGRSTSLSSTSSERYGTRNVTRGRWEKKLVYTTGFWLRFRLQTKWLHCTMQNFSHCTDSQIQILILTDQLILTANRNGIRIRVHNRVPLPQCK